MDTCLVQQATMQGAFSSVAVYICVHLLAALAIVLLARGQRLCSTHTRHQTVAFPAGRTVYSTGTLNRAWVPESDVCSGCCCTCTAHVSSSPCRGRETPQACSEQEVSASASLVRCSWTSLQLVRYVMAMTARMCTSLQMPSYPRQTEADNWAPANKTLEGLMPMPWAVMDRLVDLKKAPEQDRCFSDRLSFKHTPNSHYTPTLHFHSSMS